MGRPLEHEPKRKRYNLPVDPERIARWALAAESEDRNLGSWIRRVCDAAADESLGESRGSKKSTRGQKKAGSRG